MQASEMIEQPGCRAYSIEGIIATSKPAGGQGVGQTAGMVEYDLPRRSDGGERSTSGRALRYVTAPTRIRVWLDGAGCVCTTERPLTATETSIIRHGWKSV